MNKLTVAIVGLGRAGHFHLRSTQSLNSFTLKYIIDPGLDPALADGLGSVTVLPALDTALADPELDAVIVSSPTQFHYEHITRSLEAGKHVFTEKPLGTSVAEIKKCFDLAQETKLALHLGFQRRCDENFQALKASIPEIGQVRTIKTSSRDNPKPLLDYLRISGNIFHDMLIHDFDMLIFLLGQRIPKYVYAVGHAYDPEIGSIPDFDTVLVNLKYPDGLMCSIDTSRTAVYGYDQRIEVFAEKGMVIAENQRTTTVQLHTAAGMLVSPVQPSFPQRYKDSYAREIALFGEGIHNHQLHNVSKEECILAHLIADAAHESAVMDAVVDFENFYRSHC